MKISSHLCNFKNISRAFLVSIAILCLYSLLFSRGNVDLPVFNKDLDLGPSVIKPRTILSGLNCSLEAGIMGVKTTYIWNSKVVKEASNDEKHCIEIIFFQNDQIPPNSDFGGSEIIINMSEELSLSSVYPVVQPGFPRRGEFRHSFDIVSPPFTPDPLEMDSLNEQYDVMHNKRNTKVCSLQEHRGYIQNLFLSTDENTVILRWCNYDSSLKSTNFVVLLESMNLVANLVKSLRFGAIPIIALEQGVNVNAYLPFSEVLDWNKAILITTTKGLKAVLSELIHNLSLHTILRMQRQGQKFWQAYMSSKERVLDTTMAVVRERLGIEPPFFSDVRTQDATKPEESFFMPVIEHKRQQSLYQDVYFRWNEVFHPWERAPFPFHMGIGERELVGFPLTSRQKESEKFTIVLMSYKRQESVRELLVGLNGLDKMDRVILIWNDIQEKVPDSIISTLPKEKLFIVRPSNNSLQNRYLPMDIIRTDAIVNLDDDVRISNSDYSLGFRTWQADPSKLHGFVNRLVSQDSHGEFKYSSNTGCHYNIILGAAIFFHRFYLYQYTYIQPREIRAKVEELFNCEDIFINAMIADLTMQPGVIMRLSPNSPAPQCLSAKCTQGRAISGGTNHYNKRGLCSNLIERFYGYQTLVTSRTLIDQVNRSGC